MSYRELKSALFSRSALRGAQLVKTDPYRAISYLIPFGGMKQSGIGRESGIDAIREYQETKSVWISTEQAPPGNPFVMR